MADEKPLSGVRICDFTWAMAAPMATRLLADFGATVVRIEPHNRYDAARTQPPFRNNEQGAENSAMWSNCDAGKLSIVLDLARPLARRVALDLVRWAGGRWNHSRRARCASGGSITNRCARSGPT
jgi:crotonobetainyl-CoA:carnitine CoA-transferase CaiB-like acyl-CoA transferase